MWFGSCCLLFFRREPLGCVQEVLGWLLEKGEESRLLLSLEVEEKKGSTWHQRSSKKVPGFSSVQSNADASSPSP